MPAFRSLRRPSKGISFSQAESVVVEVMIFQNEHKLCHESFRSCPGSKYHTTQQEAV